MPRGDKDSYTAKQKRKAKHIAEAYEQRGVSDGEAEGRAWATVNKDSGGGKERGSGRGKPDTVRSAQSVSSTKRSAAAKKGWATRRAKAKKASSD